MALKAQTKGQGEALLEAVLLLVRQGFTKEEVFAMPLDVFYMYVDAAARLEAKARIEYISDTQMSVGALFAKDKKGIKQYMQVLENTYNGTGDGKQANSRIRR